jgi:pimeloyl-ACP methyl ester carboxylesterase
LGENNEKALLFLTGGSGVYEPGFQYLNYFSKEYKVITMNYPAVKTMNELIDILNTIIKKEGMNNVNVLGQSMGGMVAQVLMYKYPDLLNKVILAHTSTNSEELQGSNLKSQKEMEKAIRLIRKFPQFLLRRATKSRMKKVLKENNLPEFEFWKSLFLEGIKKRSKKELISPLHLMVDFVNSYCFLPSDFENISTNILIIDSEADKSFTEEEKRAVCNLLPKAKQIHFKDKPHLGLISHYDEYIQIIESFIV